MSSKNLNKIHMCSGNYLPMLFCYKHANYRKLIAEYDMLIALGVLYEIGWYKILL